MTENKIVICHYCHRAGHMKRDCKKLQAKIFQLIRIAYMVKTSEETVTISTYEYARLIQSSSVNAKSGKSSTCLISSSSKWVIDSGATDDMPGYPNLFSNFQSN